MTQSTTRLVFGFTHEQWMAKAVARAQIEWDRQVRLEDAFDLVKPIPHWKGPIDAVVPADRLGDVCEAITHFTAGQASAHELADGTWRVKAPGYWVSCG